MIHKRLLGEIDWLARRFRRLYLWRTLALGWLAAAALGAGLLGLGWAAGWGTSWAVPVLLGVVLLTTGASAVRAYGSARDPRWVARQVEARYPDLESLLLAAVEQRPALSDGRFGFLQESVIQGALAHSRRHDWEQAIPEQRIRKAQLAGFFGLGVLAVVCGALAGYKGRRDPAADLLPASGAARAAKHYQVTVAPGDTEIERGTSLIVTARFDGDLPDDATLVYQDTSGDTDRVAMSPSLSDPMFGARVADVQSELAYHVEYAGQETRQFRVTVFDYPRLQRADVRLVFPEYTSLEAKQVEDTRRVTAVEGTELTLLCRLNKPVAGAQLVDEAGDRIDLAAEDDGANTYAATTTLSSSARYRLHLTDAEGRANRDPPEFVFNVTPNQRPDVKLASPARDVRVSPIEELQTKASVWDDFGLRAYGIAVSLGAAPPEEVVLGQATLRNQRQGTEHLIDFEALGAQPDELLSYYFWAEDVGPDGKPRRSLGDMYFAEVRHFEEIFRQGEQPPGDSSQQQQGQQGGNAQQAQQLAELQKQIINATWTVIRREVEAVPTDKFAPDVQQLIESQQGASEQTNPLLERVSDEQSQQYVHEVRQHMAEALTHLTEAGQSASAQPLQPALSAEQAAYQALLKLRAREHQVIRSRSRGSQQASTSASGPQSRAQRQLDQLQLRDSENRYETQRTAQPEDQAQRETRQVLNRLRELARRQSDLNERLKELQSALQEAESEEEREEIRRQLKRLREQQQEILRDTDELRERMDRPENQERMAESHSQLDSTRQQIRETTEALERGQVSRAVASGTRAERQLEQMREEFRRRASGRFADQMRQLRDGARALDENETELAQQLRELDKPEPQSGRLRDPSRRERLREGFAEQRQDLDRLLDDVRETVEESEESEPLLNQKLYDALREARQQRIDDALDVTRSMLDRGLLDQARAAESQAGEGIRQLREGVEEAADSVLGDETEALRRAHEVLEDLADELDEEIRSASAQEPSPDRVAAGDEPSRNEESGRPDDQAGRTDRAPSDQQQEDSLARPGGSGPEGPDQQADRPPSSRTARQSTDDRRGGASPRSLLRQEDRADRPDSAEAIDLGAFTRADDQRPRPITGDDFLDWSDRLRDVEEMLDDAELRAEAARVRDAARGVRRQLRGGSKGPNWDIVREFVAEPLCELRDRVAEELLRRGPGETMVPIDRDPVPSKYAEQVRRYYESLGRGK